MIGNAGLLEGLTDAQIAGVRHACEQSQHYFTRFFFKARERRPFIVGQHHKLIDDTLDEVIAGLRPRIIINEPPGYSKTEQCVVMFMARGLALNKQARFIHSSYSLKLALQNSSYVRDIISLPEYQALWPMEFRDDTDAKGLWWTDDGGGMLAESSGGTITGFRAGRLGIPGFTGALVIDDALKPDDASSDERRERVNDRYMNTFRSRLAHEAVPIVVDMQRLHQRDFSNHLLTGGGGEKFHHLMLPVEIDNAKAYPTEYTHGIEIKHGLPDGPLWPRKHDAAQIDVLRKDGKVFAAQYLQDPRATDHAAFSPAMFRPYEVRPRTLNIGILVDPSGGRSKKSDRTAMAVIGVDANANKFLLDGYCHRMKLSERWDNLKRLWQRWSRATGVMAVTVGYEKYGMQSDLEHINERQEVEGVHFPIVEVNWVREGSQSKEDRIQRLEPDFKSSRFFLPCSIYRAEEGGDCFWEGKPEGVDFYVDTVDGKKARRVYGKTSSQKRIAMAGEAYRIVETIKRRDENGQMYDFTWELMSELQDFPNAAYDDLSDAVSRIYDLGIVPAPKREVDEVHGLNDSLVA